MAEVERWLAELWRAEADGERAVVRACAHNLVVITDIGSDDVAPLIAPIVRSCPGRVMIVRPGDTSGALRTYVSAACHRGGNDLIVCSEQIIIEAGAQDEGLVPAAVLQLLVEDMPVYVWWRRGEFGDGTLVAALREMAEGLIVDSARFARPNECLAELRQVLTARAPWACDLAWTRLDPWREAVAAFFDDPRMRERLGAIRRVTISGDTISASYLVGWLASRLGWTPGSVTVRLDTQPADRRVDSLALEAADSWRFDLRRTCRTDAWIASTVEGPGHNPLTHTLRLPKRDEPAWVCEVLQQRSRDPVFEAALAASASWSPP